jgi:hypothetical protein
LRFRLARPTQPVPHHNGRPSTCAATCDLAGCRKEFGGVSPRQPSATRFRRKSSERKRRGRWRAAAASSLSSSRRSRAAAASSLSSSLRSRAVLHARVGEGVLHADALGGVDAQHPGEQVDGVVGLAGEVPVVLTWGESLRRPSFVLACAHCLRFCLGVSGNLIMNRLAFSLETNPSWSSLGLPIFWQMSVSWWM